MFVDKINITKRHLPHWTSKDSVYFITFGTVDITFTINEQVLIKEHIINGNNKFYFLYACIVMTDHVHLLLKPVENYSLDKIMKGIKGVTSHKINLVRKTKGQIWQIESYDRIVRDWKEFREKMNYMYKNPIKKGLTKDTFTYPGWYFNDDVEYVVE